MFPFSTGVPELNLRLPDRPIVRRPALTFVSESTLLNPSEKLICVSTSPFQDLLVVAMLQHYLLEHEFGSILWFETPYDKFSIRFMNVSSCVVLGLLGCFVQLWSLNFVEARRS